MRGWWWSRRLRTRRGLRDALLALALLGAGGAAAQQAPDASARWQALSAEAMDAFRRGQSAEAAVAAERALALARGAFGPRHPQTLNSMNNLAFLYRSQGRHGEAEPLYREALQLTREVLGPRHPRTLAGMNNLATLYERQGRHGEAEPLYREALRLGRFAGSDDGSPKFEYGPPAAADAGREAWVTGGGDDAQVTYGRPR